MKIVKKLVVAFFKTRLLVLWSRLYRLIFERRFEGYAIKPATSIGDVAYRLLKLKWTPDSFLQLFDAVSYPGKTQAILDGVEPQPNQGTDCDEFAFYAVEQICANPKLVPGAETARMLTVVWQTSALKFGGHNVCLIEMADGSYRLFDYFMRAELFLSVEDLALFVVAKYGLGDKTTETGWDMREAKPIAWAMYDRSLRFIDSDVL